MYSPPAGEWIKHFSKLNLKFFCQSFAKSIFFLRDSNVGVRPFSYLLFPDTWPDVYYIPASELSLKSQLSLTSLKLFEAEWSGKGVSLETLINRTNSIAPYSLPLLPGRVPLRVPWACGGLPGGVALPVSCRPSWPRASALADGAWAVGDKTPHPNGSSQRHCKPQPLLFSFCDYRTCSIFLLGWRKHVERAVR